MLIFTNSYPCAAAHCFKIDLDRNQCQAVESANKHTAIKRIMMFFSLIM